MDQHPTAAEPIRRMVGVHMSRVKPVTECGNTCPFDVAGMIDGASKHRRDVPDGAVVFEPHAHGDENVGSVQVAIQTEQDSVHAPSIAPGRYFRREQTGSEPAIGAVEVRPTRRAA